VTDVDRVNKASNKSAVKLQEIGPRLTLRLVKVEEGLCSGNVIFNEFGRFMHFWTYNIQGVHISICKIKLTGLV
jgi:hypothetical protein